MTVVPTEAQHVILDIWDADPKALRDPHILLQALRDGARASGATVLHAHSHNFDGDGVSAMLILSESHAGCHTWPDLGFASFDAYTCGECETQRFIEPFVSAIKGKHVELRVVSRGVRGTVPPMAKKKA